MYSPFSALARDTILRSHTMRARADIYSPAGNVLDLPISGGEVVADAGSKVRRTATITASPEYWPASPTDLLAPFGSEARLYRGVVLPTGPTEWFPLGVFTLASTARSIPVSDSGELTVTLADRAQRVADDQPDAPAQTVSGATAVAEITRLIRITLGPDHEVLDLTGSTQVVPVVEFSGSRWEPIEKLADAIAAEVYFDVIGRTVIRPQPTLADPAVWGVSTGDLANLTKIDEVLSREKVYNKVVARGERSDGTPPVYAAVADTDPASPTRYDGPFGRKPYVYTSSLLTTVPQATATATALLARAKGTGVQVALESLVNPALEPGDVITVDKDGARATHILDRVTIPLAPDGVQQLGTRSNDLPD